MLKRVSVRRVWPNEAQHFTPWLANNLNLLGEVLGLGLSEVEREARVGKYTLDILAQDENGAKVAIENQFDVSDHKHLGQILTYTAGRKASTFIWVTSNFEDEHRTALEWLNRWTFKKIKVFGVEVRVYAIGKSIRVPRFVPVVYPAGWSKDSAIEWPSDRQEFFQPLVDDMQDKGFTYTPNGWIQQFDSKSVKGLTYNADIRNRPRVFMAMKDTVMKRRVFGDLRKRKRCMKRMEKELGLEGDQKTTINWGERQKKNGRLNYKNISVARKKPQNHPIYSYDELEEMQNWMLDYLIKFDKVFDGEVGEIMDKRGWTR